MPKENKATTVKTLTLPIKWIIPDAIITRFASNILIQSIGNEFKISFFELNPEIRLNPSDKIPTEMRADCVASIIVTADRLPSFISALQKHLDTHNEIKKKETEKT